MSRECFAVLLRGINVGRAKRIAMADLRTIAAELGWQQVRTLVNSGNLVGCASGSVEGLTVQWEEALVLRLGVAVKVTVLAHAELQTVLDENPLADQAGEGARLLVFFLREVQRLQELEGLASQDWSPGRLALGSRAAYVWCPDGVLKSDAAAALEKQLGDAATSRNWNTVLKLAQACAETPVR